VRRACHAGTHEPESGSFNSDAIHQLKAALWCADSFSQAAQNIEMSALNHPRQASTWGLPSFDGSF
jgi:hypothetical protein